MAEVAFVGQMRHYVDHLEPVWRKVGGDFCVPHALLEYARGLGIDATPYDHKAEKPPVSRRALAIVASRGDYFRLREGTPTVYMAHGNGQGFVNPEHRGYAGGPGLNHVVQFLSPNEHNAEKWRGAYPSRHIDVVGCPKMDVLPERRPRGKRPTVCISFHWDPRSTGQRLRETWTAWPYYRKAVETLARRDRPYELIGHGHPRIRNGLKRWFEKLGVEWVNDFRDVLSCADLYVNDCSSTLYEAATVMPVVVLNIPQYRREVEHGLRFWEFADVGLRVDRPQQLVGAIRSALDEHPETQRRREEIVAAVYPYRGEAAKRAAELIRARHAEGVALGHLDPVGVNAAAA